MTNWAISSANDAINSLLSLIEATLDNSIWSVFDGLPLDLPDHFVVIGGEIDATWDGTQEFLYLGARAMEENYQLNGTISSYVGGGGQSNASLSSNSQRQARNDCFSALKAINNAVLSDVQLTNWGAPFSGSGNCTFVRLTGMQTAYNDPESMKGRRLDLQFGVGVKNHLGVIG